MPDQQQYTPEEFANQIKTQYPDYKDWDNKYLVDEVTRVHPEYKSWIKSDTAQASQPQQSFLGRMISEHPMLGNVGRWLTTGDPRPTNWNGDQVLGPGLSKFPGVETASKAIENKLINTGNYWGGALGGALGYLGDMLSTGVDPRTAGVKTPEPQLIASDISPFKGVINKDIQLPVQPKGLPPAPQSVVNPTRFISGEAGIADVKQPYQIDLGAVNPRIGQQNAGTILPREVEGVNQIPPQLAANQGLSIGQPAAVNAEDALLRRTQQLTKDVSGNYPKEVGDYQLPTAEKVARVQEQIPAVKNGDVSKLPIDQAVTTATPESPVPPSGAARGINIYESNLNSAHKVLLDHPETVDVATPILEAYDKKQQWLRATMQEVSQYTKDLGKNDRIALGRILDGESSTNVQLNQRASQIRNILDTIHAQFPEGVAPEGKDVGYLDNYFTHIAKDDEGISAILKYYFGDLNPFKRETLQTTGSGLGDMYERGLGSPSSPYIEPRSGNLTDLEYNVNKVLPAYIESAARVIFDRPAVDAAKQALKKVPDNSMLKELGEWYVKNYTRYDAEAELHGAWNKLANRLASITAHSVIDFNAPLHMLHLGEIPANIFPELGAKYTALGIKNVATKPFGTWSEMARLGLLQNEIKPFSFRTPMEKWQSAAYFFNYVESLVKGVGYNGAKQKFLDMGMNADEASKRALQLAKDMTLTVDPARQMKGFSPESNIMGGEIGSRLGGQFKQVPMKIVEQYQRYAQAALQNPKEFNRWSTMVKTVLGAGTAYAGAQAGAHTFHLNPSSLFNMTALGAFGSAANDIIRDLKGGNWQKALIDTGAWAVPAGRNIQKGVEAMQDEKPKGLRFVQ